MVLVRTLKAIGYMSAAGVGLAKLRCDYTLEAPARRLKVVAVHQGASLAREFVPVECSAIGSIWQRFDVTGERLARRAKLGANLDAARREIRITIGGLRTR